MDPKDYNVLHNKVVKFISRNDEFSELMKSRFPKVAEHVTSLKVNPRCSCRRKVFKFIRSNLDDFFQFLSDFDALHPEEKIIDEVLIKKTMAKERDNKEEYNRAERLKRLQERHKNGNVSTKEVIKTNTEVSLRGEVIEITADVHSYKKLIEHLDENNMTFTGINVLESETIDEETGEMKKVWNIFFY